MSKRGEDIRKALKAEFPFLSINNIYEHPCRYCGRGENEHAAKKCLFGPTRYSPYDDFEKSEFMRRALYADKLDRSAYLKDMKSITSGADGHYSLRDFIQKKNDAILRGR